ncbi:type VI secretion system protein TssA [Ideonella sp. DXS29W]|uniref:Type VI secretion system protein TssA n=1 Tax=Ideonella lacteola TaxID=2984193 RepID=A0ABU9BV78_9BURK
MNFPQLVDALPGDNPCGEDLSFSSEFDTIQEMRRADDPSLDQGEWVTELKVADWPGVAKACEDLLCTRTKDLRVVGWLVDAWARLRGFAGLYDGLAVTAQLVERHWPQLHPQPDDGDQEQRIGNLSWLLHRVEELPRHISLATASPVGFTLLDLEAARAAGPNAGRSDQPGPPTLASIQRAVSNAGLSAFEQQKAAMDGCLHELARLQALIDAELGLAGPSFGPARRSLESARDAWVRLARDSGVATHSAGGEAASANDPETASGTGAAPVAPAAAAHVSNAPGVLNSRAQALQQLRQVADYFRRTEPHSPVAYLADKAARWGDMPLHAWLRTVVKDQGALAQLEDLLGTEPPPDQTS